MNGLWQLKLSKNHLYRQDAKKVKFMDGWLFIAYSRSQELPNDITTMGCSTLLMIPSAARFLSSISNRLFRTKHAWSNNIMNDEKVGVICFPLVLHRLHEKKSCETIDEEDLSFLAQKCPLSIGHWLWSTAQTLPRRCLWRCVLWRRLVTLGEWMNPSLLAFFMHEMLSVLLSDSAPKWLQLRSTQNSPFLGPPWRTSWTKS